jgi:FkbM family methyltransferase
MNLTRKKIKRWIRTRGYELRRLGVGELDDVSRLVRISSLHNVNVFLDVGANQGQFAIELRMAGFAGRIISFEPTSAPHEILEQRASKDPNWTVAPRMALGSRNAKAQINVSGNSYSSSMLPMMDAHLTVAPESAYVGTQETSLRRLDDVLDELGVPAKELLALKLDTQGYEAEVLAGAQSILPRVKVVFTEMSLVPLYEGAPNFDQTYAWFRSAGYHCAGLSHELTDFVSGEMLQVNGTFVRD